MAAKVDLEKCMGCGACVDGCPVGALSLNDDGKCTVDESACIGCGACEGTCPAEAITIE